MSILELDKSQRAIDLKNQTIAGTIARLFQMLVDIYGKEIGSLEKIKKREGQEVELVFKALNTTITLNLSKSQLTPHMRSSDKASATIILAMKREKLIPTIIDLIRTKNNFLGILKVLIKYVLPGKIKIKGSFGAAIKVIKLLSMGTHPMYKK